MVLIPFVDSTVKPPVMKGQIGGCVFFGHPTKQGTCAKVDPDKPVPNGPIGEDSKNDNEDDVRRGISNKYSLTDGGDESVEIELS